MKQQTYEEFKAEAIAILTRPDVITFLEAYAIDFALRDEIVEAIRLDPEHKIRREEELDYDDEFAVPPEKWNLPGLQGSISIFGFEDDYGLLVYLRWHPRSTRNVARVLNVTAAPFLVPLSGVLAAARYDRDILEYLPVHGKGRAIGTAHRIVGHVPTEAPEISRAIGKHIVATHIVEPDISADPDYPRIWSVLLKARQR